MVSEIGMETGLTLGRENEVGSRKLEPELVDVRRDPPKTISNLEKEIFLPKLVKN